MSDHEESHIESLRRRVEDQYAEHPTGCGCDFGEILCWEIHANGLTFLWLAEKWGIPVSILGELIYDHCKKLEPLLVVNHEYDSPAEATECEPRPIPRSGEEGE